MSLFIRILLVIALSIPSAILYRLGGASQADQDAEFPWIPRWFKDLPKKRDVGCTLLMMAGALLMGVQAPWYAWLLTFGLSWGAVSTYHDWLFGYDNHFFHGLMIGIAFFPLVIWGNVAITPFLVKSILLGLLMGGWSYYVDEIWQPLRSDIWTERGRGLFMPLVNLIRLFF